MSTQTGWLAYLDRLDRSLERAERALGARQIEKVLRVIDEIGDPGDREELPALPGELERRARVTLARVEAVERGISEARRSIGRELAAAAKPPAPDRAVPRFIDHRG